MFNRCRRALASLVIVSLFVVGPAFAAPQAIFSGKVLQQDGVTPRSGVVVTLYDERSETTYSSSPSNDEGAFRVETAPPGTYGVVAEVDEGAYLAGGTVSVRPGENRPVSLTLNDVKPSYQTTPTTSGQSGGLSPVVRWIIVGGIVVAAALVIDEVTDDQEQLSTPF